MVSPNQRVATMRAALAGTCGQLNRNPHLPLDLLQVAKAGMSQGPAFGVLPILNATRAHFKVQCGVADEKEGQTEGYVFLHNSTVRFSRKACCSPLLAYPSGFATTRQRQGTSPRMPSTTKSLKQCKCP